MEMKYKTIVDGKTITGTYDELVKIIRYCRTIGYPIEKVG